MQCPRSWPVTRVRDAAESGCRSPVGRPDQNTRARDGIPLTAATVALVRRREWLSPEVIKRPSSA